MTAQLDEFCVVLEEELHRQTAVREALESQYAALADRDIEGLEAATARLRILSREALAAQTRRMALLDHVVETFGLPERNLSHIVAAVDEPWKSRVATLQSRLKSVLQAVEPLVQRNTVMMQQSARITERALASLHDEPSGAFDYAYLPSRRTASVRQPAFIDQRG